MGLLVSKSIRPGYWTFPREHMSGAENGAEQVKNSWRGSEAVSGL